ncbi:DUF3307 domain-containing protein [Aquimarina intermedia]|uniref:Uncharacterized protein DUF3307 n=1 Tax=Aquimarina intermedia TaxID=350814 RepID=A0A5S5BW10_9FLAO|nr:DUF3307 domain-containing protein [Aquimarina intermedia]TYP70372.1 uncharacterized protein DUF3307 [Aquimarina intermedia]
MMLLVLKLIIAHVLGDFVLQPDTWVADKKEKKQASLFLYLHTLVHAVTLLCMLSFDRRYLLAILIIVFSHFLIDLIKLNLDKKVNFKLLFLLDQLAHLLVIAGIVYWYQPFSIDLSRVYSIEILYLVLAIIAVTSISSVIMKLLMSTWNLNEDHAKDSLEKAGKYIGILERLFVFAFIALGQWAAIGFLITAKSVFRFGDLSKAKDRKLTEYVLIGTLLSFGLAMIVGLLYTYAMGILSVTEI